jgi:hemerythrin-like metal-binding protein
MAHFEWDPALETGHADVDEQHRSLFALANALQDSLITHENDAEVVTDAVYRLTDYVVQHFADEEALMERNAYPATNSHRGLHGQLTAETMRLAARYFNEDDVLPETLAPFLTSWLTEHIRKEDMLMVRFVKSRAGG